MFKFVEIFMWIAKYYFYGGVFRSEETDSKLYKTYYQLIIPMMQICNPCLRRSKMSPMTRIGNPCQQPDSADWQFVLADKKERTFRISQ